MEAVECVVIGAGVVGLAVARAMAMRGHEVLVLEAEGRIGTVTSARNSGVIHAGLYYRPDSLKARLCVAGRDRLYAYAAERRLTHKRCGKLVVATDDEQIAALQDLRDNAARNGVPDLRLLSAAAARRLEPALHCVAALHVPISGMIEVHELLGALLGDAEAHGTILALNAPVLRGAVGAAGAFTLEVGGGHAMTLSCQTLINAAGLGAQAVARSLQGVPPTTIPPQVLAKGSYFTVSGKAPFQSLIYPLPEHGSSGLHFSCDFGGQARFGPDVEWVDVIDYRVDPARTALFEDAVRRYWPDLPSGALTPDFSGIRPKLACTSQHDSDFVIQDQTTHGVRGLVNLYGIESPGLTSCMAIGEAVAATL